MTCEDLATKSDIQLLFNEISSIKNEISGLKNFITQEFDSIENSISAVSQQIALNHREVIGKLTEIINLINACCQKIDEIKNIVLEIKIEIKNINISIKDLIRITNEIKVSIKNIENNINSIYAIIQSLVVTINQLIETLSIIQTLIAEIRIAIQTINALSAKIDVAINKISSIEIELSKINNNLSALITEIRASFTQISIQITQQTFYLTSIQNTTNLTYSNTLDLSNSLSITTSNLVSISVSIPNITRQLTIIIASMSQEINQLETQITNLNNRLRAEITATIQQSTNNNHNLLLLLLQKITFSSISNLSDCGRAGDYDGAAFILEKTGEQTLTDFSSVFNRLLEEIYIIKSIVCETKQSYGVLNNFSYVEACQVDDEGNYFVAPIEYSEENPKPAWRDAWDIAVNQDTGGQQVQISYMLWRYLPLIFEALYESQKFNLELLCKKETKEENTILLPDPSAVTNTEGYYIFFYWELAQLIEEKDSRWRHKTQLANPIDILINPPNPDAIWEQYFASIYQVLGNQWGQVYSKDVNRRLPLYKGWFFDKDEGRRFFNSLKDLTKYVFREINNPTFTDADNKTTRIVNIGRVIRLYKVCIGYKGLQTDETAILQSYAPAK